MIPLDCRWLVQGKAINKLMTIVTPGCERVIQTIRHECLNHFIIVGHQNLDYLLPRITEHYNEQRAHNSLNPLQPACNDPPPQNNEINMDEIVCRIDLSGVINSYECNAAQMG